MTNGKWKMENPESLICHLPFSICHFSFSVLLAWPSSFVAQNERHRFRARALVLQEAAAQRAGDRFGARLLDAAHFDAHMLGFDDHHHTGWSKHLVEQVRDLGCESFLNLRLARHQVGHPRKLRQTHYAAVLRNVSDVRDSEKRQQMMLADRVKRDVLDDHHL